MYRNSPRPLGELMRQLMRSLDEGSRLGDALIVAAWQDVSGNQIAHVTEKVWLDKRRLYVKVNSASWRNELHLQRRQWCDKVNEQLGKRMIDEVIFR